uniref:Myb-like domain-containing protein n=1 Tax=Odontella aurita TaxID=265563 RepID=A0A7S4JL48_9STRA
MGYPGGRPSASLALTERALAVKEKQEPLHPWYSDDWRRIVEFLPIDVGRDGNDDGDNAEISKDVVARPSPPVPRSPSMMSARRDDAHEYEIEAEDDISLNVNSSPEKVTTITPPRESSTRRSRRSERSRRRRRRRRIRSRWVRAEYEDGDGSEDEDEEDPRDRHRLQEVRDGWYSELGAHSRGRDDSDNEEEDDDCAHDRERTNKRLRCAPHPSASASRSRSRSEQSLSSEESRETGRRHAGHDVRRQQDFRPTVMASTRAPPIAASVSALGAAPNAIRPTQTSRPRRPAGRRGKNMFADDEKAAIIAGVAKWGMGKWAKIKADPSFAERLRERTPVQIKDAYRTMWKGREASGPR